jgi:hypothetical protein
MPTIQSKLLEILQTQLDTSDPMYYYTHYEHIAKQKLYEALFKYSLWNVLNYRFTEQALYIKIQKGDKIKRFGFYPIKYDSIYVSDQTFTLVEDILDSCFYTHREEFMVKLASCCASGFYNEYGSYE